MDIVEKRLCKLGNILLEKKYQIVEEKEGKLMRPKKNMKLDVN